jgi:FtsP/CotA-like multicopper oxidase with cupredoxin domain
MPDTKLSRRWFALLGGLGILTAAGCSVIQPASNAANSSSTPANGANSTPMPGMDMSGAATPSPAATRTADQIRQAADEMDAAMEARIKAFPARTAKQGNQPLTPKLDGNTKVFELTASIIKWEVEPDKLFEAWVYNEQLPGPELRVTEGDNVRVILHNQLEQSTSIHFHGLHIVNAMDGVPGITQSPIKPFETFTYEFTATPAGSHMYHSHHNSTKQVGMGLLGAFIVEPKDPTTRPAFDKEYTMILNDGAQGFTLTGKSFPATQPLTAKLGQKVLIRFMNEGTMIHPMHLHGMPMLVVAKDGYPLPQPYNCDTLLVAPGERWDAIVTADNPGTWAFHCHILPHAESEAGMFGMVTALIVEK